MNLISIKYLSNNGFDKMLEEKFTLECQNNDQAREVIKKAIIFLCQKFSEDFRVSSDKDLCFYEKWKEEFNSELEIVDDCIGKVHFNSYKEYLFFMVQFS